MVAWYLGMIKDMPPLDILITDEDCPYSDCFLDARPLPQNFKDNAWELRSMHEIEDARQQAELWHWRSRTLALQRSKAIAKNEKNLNHIERS